MSDLNKRHQSKPPEQRESETSQNIARTWCRVVRAVRRQRVGCRRRRGVAPWVRAVCQILGRELPLVALRQPRTPPAAVLPGLTQPDVRHWLLLGTAVKHTQATSDTSESN